MLQLHSYLNKLYKIQWYFNEKDKLDLESLLFVKFKQVNDYYLIDNVQYTYVDILLGLEDMNFEIIKTEREVKLKILKI